MEREPDFTLTTNTPYLAHKGELWGAYCEYFGQNWPPHNSTALHVFAFSTTGTLYFSTLIMYCMVMDINPLCTQNMPTLTHAVHIRTSSKTAGSHSWEVGATVNSLLGDTFSYDNNMHGADLMFVSRLRSTIYFTNFVSHDPIVLYSWYTEPCYKGSLLYWNFNIQKQCYWSFYLIHIQYQLFKYMHALKNLLLRQEIPAFCFSFYFWYTAEITIHLWMLEMKYN